MKKLMILTIFMSAQMCGCGSCNANATASENNIVINKSTKTIKLKITGMTCAGCSNHVTQTLEGVKGVSKVDLEYPGDVAIIEYDPKATNKEELIAAIEKINYKAEVLESKTK